MTTDPTRSQAWAQAMAAFDAWAELPVADRPAWLADLASAQPPVHAKLLALIRADEEAQARAFLDAGMATMVGAADRPAAILAGREFGHWQAERLIGSGGMGQVWLARRSDGLYEGQAAIKLMRLTVADAHANARFAREGQLLGRLNHPHIAKLLDAGVTPAGERYLVLEYVEGERIDRWCDQQRLNIAQRLALFLVVCQAVAHAHQNLVVHRDLKPSNIFVTSTGEVKLLDFGVAKLIESETADNDALTQAQGVALTPAYASPEQLSGGVVTTATDVYGLGLVLYRLLSGVGPFNDDAMPTPAGAAQRSSQARPLWTAPAQADEAKRIANERATSVAALHKALQGDVAVVIAKALKADPAQRYASVGDFAADLQRTLDQQPISARPDSVVYRSGKFLRRHWFGAGAAALIVLAVLGGVTGTLVKERQAQREAARAVAVKRFMLDMFDQTRTDVQSSGLQVREATVQDMLKAGAARVDGAFAQQPEMRDEVFEVLQRLYSDAFEPQQATALARRRLALAQTAFGADGPRSAASEIGLAAALIEQGETAAASPLLQHAQTMLDRAGDHQSLQRARLLRWQGVMVLIDGSKPPWALHPLRLSVALMRERYADDDELLLALVSLPAEACRFGHVEEAISAADELERRTHKRYGTDNIYADTARLLHGQMLLAQGQLAQAVPLLQAAHEGYRRHLGGKNQNVLLSQLELVEAYWRLGQKSESQQLLTAAEQAAARDHAGEPMVARMLKSTQTDIAKLQAGQTLHPCGP